MGKALASMTAFARGGGYAQGHRYTIEIKTVNARGLDLRLRVASGLDDLEQKLRKKIDARLTRGAVHFNLSVSSDAAQTEIQVNQQALDVILDAINGLAGRADMDKPRPEGILALKGVLEIKDSELSASAKTELAADILQTLDQVLNDLVAGREAEGAQLYKVLVQQIDEIERLTEAAQQHPAREREVILAKLKTQVEQIGATDAGLSEERLHQEALILATKADIREELDRLRAHVQAARKLLEQGGAVGRKLDFLAQEFNREANTLCSKSNHVDLTSIGLDLKAVIDQLREQVQNIE